MATAISGGARIRENIPARNAYNALQASNDDIALRQLRLSTGKRINAASDDVAGFITSKALSSRRLALESAKIAVSEAKNVTSIVQNALEQVGDLLNDIKSLASRAASGALGSDERVSLAQASFRLSEQIQTIVDSTVFGGRELLDGTFSGDWNIGFKADNTLITLGINLKQDNTEFNITGTGTADFNLNATSTSGFAGVSGFDLTEFENVADNDFGIFAADTISTTLQSIDSALNNVSKVATYVGSIEARLTSQDRLLTSQITNYSAAISQIQDADVAQEQLSLIKSQFLQQASLISLTQANQNPQSFLQLFR